MPRPQSSQPSYLSPPASVSLTFASGSPSASPAPAWRLQDDRRSLRLCAYKIAHSVHLFWKPAAGAFGNHIGLFPLGVAMRFPAGTEPIETSEPYRLMRQLFAARCWARKSGPSFPIYNGKRLGKNCARWKATPAYKRVHMLGGSGVTPYHDTSRHNREALWLQNTPRTLTTSCTSPDKTLAECCLYTRTYPCLAAHCLHVL